MNISTKFSSSHCSDSPLRPKREEDPLDVIEYYGWMGWFHDPAWEDLPPNDRDLVDPMHWASRHCIDLYDRAHKDHRDLVELFGSWTASGGNLSSYPFLLWAVGHSCVDLTDYLIRQGANVNEIDEEGEYPLGVLGTRHEILGSLDCNYWSSRYSPNYEFLKRTRGEDWQGPNHFTNRLNCREAKVKIRSLLREAGARDFGKLVHAASRGNLLRVKRLVEAGWPVHIRNASGFTPLVKAVIGGHKETVRFLLERGANPCWQMYPDPLIEALERGNPAIVSLLFGAGATVWHDSHLPLLKRVEIVDPEIAAMVVKALPGGVSTLRDNDGNTLLHEATSKTLQAFKPWFQKPLYNTRNYLGQTPLLVAILGGEVAAVEEILQSGADPNAYSAGSDVKQFFTRFGFILMEFGIEQNLFMLTPLHAAIATADDALVECLLRHGARDDLSVYIFSKDRGVSDGNISALREDINEFWPEAFPTNEWLRKHDRRRKSDNPSQQPENLRHQWLEEFSTYEFRAGCPLYGEASSLPKRELLLLLHRILECPDHVQRYKDLIVPIRTAEWIALYSELKQSDSI